MSLTVYLGIDVGSVTTKLALVDEKVSMLTVICLELQVNLLWRCKKD